MYLVQQVFAACLHLMHPRTLESLNTAVSKLDLWCVTWRGLNNATGSVCSDGSWKPVLKLTLLTLMKACSPEALLRSGRLGVGWILSKLCCPGPVQAPCRPQSYCSIAAPALCDSGSLFLFSPPGPNRLWELGIHKLNR